MDRLERQKFKLNALLSITQAINENLPPEDLLHRADEVLRGDELNIGKVAIIMNNGKWEWVLESGCPPDSCKKISLEDVLFPVMEITSVSSSEDESLKDFDTIIPIYNNNAPLAYALIGDIDEEGDLVSPVIKHMNFIQTLLNIVVVAIDNIRLFANSLRQEALKKELELASKMQSMLIPDNDTLPQNQKILVTGFYLPHLEVGGDYYDCMKLNDDDYGFCIADVSGKGISAALLMANFQATLRALFNFNISLEELVIKLNNSVISSAHGEKFITLFIAKYYGKSRVLEYVNAAHNPPVLYDSVENKISMLESDNVGIGMLDIMPSVTVRSRKLKGQSKLICYTDGLSELPDENGIESGTTAIEQIITNSDRVDTNINDLISNQQIVEENSRLFDDVSILGVQFYD